MVSWISLIPSLVLFLVACISKNVIFALWASLISALLLITQGNIPMAGALFFKRFFDYFYDIDTIMLYVFLIGIGSIIALLTLLKTRYVPHEKHKRIILHSKKAVERSVLLLSLIFSIDDYLSILSVGFIIQHIVEKYNLTPARFAYFIHALAGPLVVMIPISSWTAAITSQLDQAGFQAVMHKNTVVLSDPLFAYVHMLPYIFYSIFTIFSIFIFIQLQICFEKDKKTNETLTEFTLPHYQLFDIFLPLGILLLLTLCGLLYSGNFYLFGGNNGVIDAFRNNKATFPVLGISSWLAFLVGFYKAYYDKLLKKQEVVLAIKNGFFVMYHACYIIILASLFSSLIRTDLKTGVYLADTLLSNVSLVFMPFIAFFTATIITLITGTAWGTFALMIPIITQIMVTKSGLSTPFFLEHIPLLVPALGAVFSGSVLGDHLSLFSETTVMTATTLRMQTLDHAKTQFLYAIPAVITSFILYFLIGYAVVYNISLLLIISFGFLLCFLLILLMQKMVQNKSYAR